MTVKSTYSTVLSTLIVAETRTGVGILALTLLLFCHISTCPEVCAINHVLRNLLFSCSGESFSLSLCHYNA